MAKRPTKKEPQETGLLAALKFISVAQHDAGSPFQTHSRFTELNGKPYVIANDGIIGAGYPVTEQLNICPHTKRFIDALEKARGAVSFTALDNKSLVIKTDKFRAVISCLGDGDLTYNWPDPPSYPINRDFIRAAALAGLFCTAGAQTVMAASVMTRNHSVVGTTGIVAIEAWHGIAMPPGLIIPIDFIRASEKVESPLTHFGFSDSSITLHFENESWLKTQLYHERYPNIDKVLAYTEVAKVVPFNKELIDALKAVLPFADGNRVFMRNEKLQSHENENVGAAYSTKAAYCEVAFNGKMMLTLADYLTQVDFTGNESVISFFGDKMRGVLAIMDNH